jgi:hypothetical protein
MTIGLVVKMFLIMFGMYIFGRNLIFKGLFLKETLYEVFSSLNVKEVQKF